MDVGPAEVLRQSSTALLTTYRRDGRPVATPVSVALHEGLAYFVTAADSGKARRLGRRADVTLAPCTLRGEPLGPAVAGSARPVPGSSPWRSSLLRPMGGLFGSWLMYRLRGHRMVLFEVDLRSAAGAGVREDAGWTCGAVRERAQRHTEFSLVA